MDAVLVLEDFQVMEGGGGLSSVSAWSQIGLLLHELERFPGICILIANVAQGSAIVRLNPELVRRLRFVVEFKMPDQSVRTAMWKKMLPTKAPLAADIDFEELGKRFAFTSGAISSATVRAAAKAALRTGEANIIKQKDLLKAPEAEKAHEMPELLIFHAKTRLKVGFYGRFDRWLVAAWKIFGMVVGLFYKNRTHFVDLAVLDQCRPLL